MTTLAIVVNEDVTFNIVTRESDSYSKTAYVSFTRSDSGDSRKCDELFLTPDHLEQLGRFLIKQADTIRNNN